MLRVFLWFAAIMLPTTAMASNLTTGPGMDGCLIWKKNGQAVIYMDDRDFKWYEIHKMDPCGEMQRKITSRSPADNVILVHGRRDCRYAVSEQYDQKHIGYLADKTCGPYFNPADDPANQ